jgi:hypothetical protein
MSTQTEFPDLIKAGLKVGDTVYSHIFGEGKVMSISQPDSFEAHFPYRVLSFDAKGFHESIDLIPTITLTPWNPIAGEPFPFPKFEPKVGEVYAFWDSTTGGFIVNRFEKMSGVTYVTSNGLNWYNCASIKEAMRIFGFDKPQRHE